MIFTTLFGPGGVFPAMSQAARSGHEAQHSGNGEWIGAAIVIIAALALIYEILRNKDGD